MSDILFRYLLLARRRDFSWPRRLFLADENLLGGGVEQLVESAAAHVLVTSQHERHTQERVEKPASRHRTVRFYESAQPVRPKPGQFEEDTQEFPLKDSLRIVTCSDCSGRGQVRCGFCSGRGQTRCIGCGGSGRLSKDGKSIRCGVCGGDGRTRCMRCMGDGRVTCGDCDGEGQVARWQVEVFRYLLEKRAHEELPPNGGNRLARAFRRWLDRRDDSVASLTPEAAAEHLDYETPEALAVVAAADAERQRMEKEAQGSKDRYLFHQSDCKLSPVGYTVLRWRTRARTYWLVGRDEQAIEVAPIGRPDGAKMGGWLGLGVASAATWEGVVDGYQLALPGIFDTLGFMADASLESLAATSVAGVLLATRGVWRIAHRPPPVRTLVILPTSGKPTPWLPLVAYLGSYTSRLKVLDRNYARRLDRLRGKLGNERQSHSLTVQTLEGEILRLVETPAYLDFSREQILGMFEAVDAVLVLGDGPPPPLSHDLERLAKDVHHPPPIASTPIDRDPDSSLDGTGPLPLEALRCSFVDPDVKETDWDQQFLRLWDPAETLLTTALGSTTQDHG